MQGKDGKLKEVKMNKRINLNKRIILKKRILALYFKLRTFYLYNFNRVYLMKWAKRRRGKCLMCGKCCGCCVYLLENNKCSVHNNVPRWCGKDFPRDPFDLKYSSCKGYWFE